MKREIPYVEKWMFTLLKISWDEIFTNVARKFEEGGKARIKELITIR